MSNHDQFLIEPRLQAPPPADAPASGIRTILMHVQNDATLDSRLDNALSLARALGAHLDCLHVTPIEAYVAFDTFGGAFVMNDVITALDEEECKVRSRIEEDLGNEDVSWDYEQVTGHVISQIARRAALADLVVAGRSAHRSDFVDAGISLLGDLLHRSRTPIFIPAEGGKPCDPTSPALVAWDGSYEAANAVRLALGLLASASSVHVVHIKEEKHSSFPNTRLLEYLSRHDIHAELTVVSEPKLDRDLIPDALVALAMSIGASYMVMGGYNHTRLSEYVFGGVTRKFLMESPLPLVIAH